MFFSRPQWAAHGCREEVFLPDGSSRAVRVGATTLLRKLRTLVAEKVPVEEEHFFIFQETAGLDTWRLLPQSAAVTGGAWPAEQRCDGHALQRPCRPEHPEAPCLAG